MPSQHGEDAIIKEFFGDPSNGMYQVGTFLDIGAHDGVSNSNTRALVEAGWGGTCVEAAANAVDALLHNCRGHANIKVVHAAMAATTGLVPFWHCHDQVSTLSAAHHQLWGERVGVPYDLMHTCGVTWAMLLDVLPGPYEFIDIDTEGTSAELAMQLREIDLVGTRMICIEHDGRIPEIHSHFKPLGFYHLATCVDNIIIARRDSP